MQTTTLTIEGWRPPSFGDRLGVAITAETMSATVNGQVVSKPVSIAPLRRGTVLWPLVEFHTSLLSASDMMNIAPVFGESLALGRQTIVKLNN